MVNRMRFGYNAAVNDYGMFISKPGLDISNVSTNYLLDSRYRTLSVHAHGLDTMTRSTAVSGQTIWYSEITFADLGYRPVFYGSIRYDSANSAGLPVNCCGFPLSYCASYRQNGSSGERLTTNSVWWVSNTTLRAKAIMNVNGSGGQMTFQWIVFRNRFE
jgi:hypothetical protein